MTATTAEQAIDTGARGAAKNHTDQQSREEFIAWLTASCERQGLPVAVTDATTLAAIATLLH